MPGIGAYTAAAIAAIAFGRDASPVDGNIERVVGRLYAVEEPLPSAKPRIKALAEALTPLGRAGDFAQAMMDLGATICTPNNPACALCPFFDGCLARRRGDQESFPRKMPKAEGRLRRGAAFWVCRPDGAVLVRTRPARGLLGGMTELPGSEWTPQFADADAVPTATALLPAVSAARWLQLPGTVTHVFTHFPLELTVWAATLSARSAAPAGMRWVAAAKLDDEALPSLMRKVVAHARRHSDASSDQS